MDLQTYEVRARQLDETDKLARFRGEFFCSPGVIYFEGNSLGLLSRPAEEAVLRVLDDWRTFGISGWLSASPPWFSMAEEVGALMASLVGAAPDELGVGDSTTINLHKLLALFYRPGRAGSVSDRSPRPRLLTDELDFPSDLYALRSHVRLHGRDPDQDVITVRSRDGHTIAEEDIVAAMTDDVQMAVVSAVLYRSGQLLDIGRLAREAQARGILLAVDCSHSVGVVPHQLDAWGVDCAFWCTYKSLNSGPGGVAAWYLNRKHFGRSPGLAGWFGSRKERQFEMAPELDPAPDAACLQVGTPSILSMAPLLGTLRMIGEAGIGQLRAKSLGLTSFLIQLLEDRVGRYGFALAGPRENDRRGGHVAVSHPEALRISKALREAKVIVDYRPPDLVRFGPSPLYNSFAECCEAVKRLETIMAARTYEQHASQPDLVT
jgi:kynureninase